MAQITQRHSLDEKLIAGVNGFGRFGLHLLKYWLDRSSDAAFRIGMINDDTLSINDAHRIITTDEMVKLDRYKFKVSGEHLLVSTPLGDNHRIRYTNAGQGSLEAIPWIGQPDLVFECSGKQAEFPQKCQAYLTGNTSHVVISATSWDVDKTLVFGFNHRDFDPTADRVTSYGSCTVNAYVPLAQWVNEKYGVVDSSVHVAHNKVGYKLGDLKHQTLFRKPCTLERSGPELLDFLDSEKFLVDYVVGPFTNVSAITFRFGVEDPVERELFLQELKGAVGEGGPLHGLYGVEATDPSDSNAYNCTPFSSVFIEDTVQVRGNNIYLQGYFDNENSVNRFYDLINHMAKQDGIKK